ncbi:MAG: hypothetical protein ACD_45C00259G0004 [uncultured bacterium]|nr:MAG: hypothetical protein ACD_45C00259G0004 [uncultured bacterium]OGT54713.1 MAG: hypothetical protein A3F43_05925 [Gammaproteobacteria bacterium RIFCSPHIGHO2_12_FULL_42_10]
MRHIFVLCKRSLIIVFISIICFSLVACKKTECTVSYFLSHPSFLEQSLKKCLSTDHALSHKQAKQCVLAYGARDRMKFYLDQEQQDPEKFGESILSYEMRAASSKLALDRERQNVRTLEAQHVSWGVLSVAKKRFFQAKEQYESDQRTVDTVLAIAGLQSPE